MDPLWTMTLTVVGGALCIYLFFTRNFGYFKKRGIPFVEPVPIFGNTAGIIFKTKTMHDAVQEAYDCHPDAKYVGFFDCSTPVILLKDPELVKSVAIKNFDSFPNHRMFADFPTEPVFGKSLFSLKDDAWRDMRALLSPAFTSSRMKIMFTTLSQCAVKFADHLAQLNPPPEELDAKDAFGRYAIDVIASQAFGLTIDSMKDRDNEFYKLGKSITDFSGLKIMKFFILRHCPFLARLLGVRLVDPNITNFFANAIETTIATRDAQGIVRPDMLQLMMQARNREEKSTLSKEDMSAQAFNFLLGGYDAPSTTLSFAAHELALNPDVQRKLQAEIDQVLEKGAGELSYEDLHAMKYLDAVVSETLRMYPGGASLDRIGPKSFTLPPALPGLEPLRINPGQNIWLPFYSFHRDPKYYTDPEKFYPERFCDQNKSKISSLTYFPFGMGPRICIASRFGLMEVKLALFHLLAKCTLLPSAKTQSPIRLSTKSILTTPEGGFWLKIVPR